MYRNTGKRACDKDINKKKVSKLTNRNLFFADFFLRISNTGKRTCKKYINKKYLSITKHIRSCSFFMTTDDVEGYALEQITTLDYYRTWTNWPADTTLPNQTYCSHFGRVFLYLLCMSHSRDIVLWWASKGHLSYTCILETEMSPWFTFAFVEWYESFI